MHCNVTLKTCCSSPLSEKEVEINLDVSRIIANEEQEDTKESTTTRFALEEEFISTDLHENIVMSKTSDINPTHAEIISMNGADIIDDQNHKNLEEEKIIIADLEGSAIVQCPELYFYKSEPLVLPEACSRMSLKHSNKSIPEKYTKKA